MLLGFAIGPRATIAVLSASGIELGRGLGGFPLLLVYLWRMLTLSVGRDGGLLVLGRASSNGFHRVTAHGGRPGRTTGGTGSGGNPGGTAGPIRGPYHVLLTAGRSVGGGSRTHFGAAFRRFVVFRGTRFARFLRVDRGSATTTTQ